MFLANITQKIILKYKTECNYLYNYFVNKYEKDEDEEDVIDAIERDFKNDDNDEKIPEFINAFIYDLNSMRENNTLYKMRNKDNFMNTIETRIKKLVTKYFMQKQLKQKKII